MAIYNINLDLDKEYIKLINDIYKVVVILVVFQAFIFYSNVSKNIINTALTGNLLNDEFMSLLIFIILGISAYYLVFDKIVAFY
jgi:hypothetical protein